MKNEDILASDIGQYTNLHAHCRLASPLDGFSDVDEYVQRAKAMGLKGVCFSDHGLMAAAYELDKICGKHGMKAIYANELYFTPNDPLRKEKIEGSKPAYHILIIAYNQVGYQNMLKLSSDAWTKYRYYKPRVSWEQLEAHSEGLVCLSACFPPGEQVLTTSGYQNIESVSADVFNSDGTPSSATRTIIAYDGEIKNVSFRYGQNTKCTDDHKFLLLKKSYLHNKHRYTVDNITEYPSESLIYSNELGDGLSLINISSLLYSENDLDNNLCFLLGAFAAEGHYIKYKAKDTLVYKGIGLTLHSNEAQYRDKILAYAKSIDPNCSCSYIIRKKYNRCDITISSKIIKDLCLLHIGEYSNKKFISSILMYSNISNRLYFLSGYFYGDGYYRTRNDSINKSKQKHNSHEFTIATTSKSLAQSVCYMAMSCNIKLSHTTVLAKVDKLAVFHQESYYLRAYGEFSLNAKKLMDYVEDLYIFNSNDFLIKEDFICNSQKFLINKITSITKYYYSGNVHCLSVPNKNSFVANLSIVHNCLGGYPQQLLLEGRNEDAELSILRFKNIFGEHYYLEMQWTGIPEQETVNAFFKEMSAKHNIPLVITCDSHYTYKDESELHRALVTINTGGVYRKKVEKKDGELTDENKDTDEGSMFYTPGEYYLKPYHVLRDHFNSDEDLVAFANTNKIAEMCSVKLPKDLKIFPQIVDDPEKYVMDRCNAFLEKHCKDMDDAERKVYYDRLEEESWVISRMEYFDYFVVVHDIIEYCKNNNILTGLGRGSASGCLISYCLGITGIDPLTYGLLFSRFLSSSRAKLPLIEFDGYPLLEHNYG